MAKETLIFFGNERLATGLAETHTPVLRALIEDDYQIAAVVANHEAATSRRGRPLEIVTFAEQHGIPILLPKRLSEITEQLAGYKAMAGVLAAYGRIIPQSIIDFFPRGIVNLHPSLLPLYRGPTPLEQAILDGTEQTGVSIMQLTARMDEGPVFVQKTLSLSSNETKAELAATLGAMGAKLLVQQLPGILEGTAALQPQDNAGATYTHLIAKTDGQIDWAKPALQIEREIRAYLGWPGSQTELFGRQVTVTAAHIANPDETANQKLLGHETGSNYLIIDALIPASKREMTGQAFLAGQR